MSLLFQIWLFLAMSFPGVIKPGSGSDLKPGYETPSINHEAPVDIVDIERNSGGSNFYFNKRS